MKFYCIEDSRIKNSLMLILFRSKTAYVGHFFSELQKVFLARFIANAFLDLIRYSRYLS